MGSPPPWSATGCLCRAGQPGQVPQDVGRPPDTAARHTTREAADSACVTRQFHATALAARAARKDRRSRPARVPDRQPEWGRRALDRTGGRRLLIRTSPCPRGSVTAWPTYARRPLPAHRVQHDRVPAPPQKTQALTARPRVRGDRDLRRPLRSRAQYWRSRLAMAAERDAGRSIGQRMIEADGSNCRSRSRRSAVRSGVTRSVGSQQFP